MAVRFVYFDLGNVLLNFSVQRLLYQVSELTGRSEEEVRHVLFGEKKYQHLECGDITPQEYFDQVCVAFDLKINPNDFIEATNNIFWVNESILPVIRHMAKVFQPRGILSNTGPAHWHYFQSTFHCITSLFPKHLITSFQVKCMKPFPKIFEAALAEARLELPDLLPEEVLFIDDLEANVLGARDVGFVAYHYQDTPQLIEELVRLGLPTPEAPRLE